ncbi:MAG TPA: hypothetical protein VFR90_11575 [Methylibium sp.]|uniref:hypothetical protein n=1 Tax=Methylibium sp. TaxID=2067992 RepID=UPI002DBB4E6D|nr:hypothetical protein [Methylibium sp.]HEU4459753.1 hypothetical protein [Methylibium sp.]
MAMRLIVGDRTVAEAAAVDAKLVALIAKAQRWFAALASGECNRLAEVAARDGVGSPHVARVMRLALLTPDIVGRIRTGEVPPDLTAERLNRIGELPIEWGAQRRLLGMSD